MQRITEKRYIIVQVQSTRKAISNELQVNGIRQKAEGWLQEIAKANVADSSSNITLSINVAFRT